MNGEKLYPERGHAVWRWVVTGCLALISMGTGLASNEASTPERIELWQGLAPVGSGRATTNEVFITIHRPARPNGAAIVICPGGGYGGLVTGPEGTGIAQWLNQHGVVGVVLEYRLPKGNPLPPLYDVQRAIRTVRFNAKAWGCDSQRVGVMGFSAGGHLASSAATHFDSGDPRSPDPIAQVGCRPDFAVLIYPVITLGEGTHLGSKANLLGPDPAAEQVTLYSNEKQVSNLTPATFLAHALDDQAVPPQNSRAFYDALRASRVAAEYLELPSGGHGLNGYKGPMWDAWQTACLKWLSSLAFIPATDAPDRTTPNPSRSFPEYEALINGPQQVRLLPGQREVVFTMYGAPAELEKIRQLAGVMREQNLGNGFDPGPSPFPGARPIFDFLSTVGWPVICYPGGDMQIKGGRGPLIRENEAVLDPMDRAGIFTAVQLGEWGYYFHNLSLNQSWWRDNFGKDFDAFKHLMKPEGLAGYDRRPTTKQECFGVIKDYFTSKSRDLLGRVISVTGHSHYEAYAGEWGARCIGLEVGENIAFTQSKFAFARGASRQWQKPWSVQVSPWLSGACTSSGPLRKEGGNARGLDAGHSLSFYERMWLHAWFAGAAMVTPENSIAIFFEKAEAPWTLTSHGRKAAEVFAFMRGHERGVPYVPIAVVLDHFAGYNGYMDKPWGILNPTAGDREARDLFDHQLFPGSDHIHTNPFPANPELSYLRPTPFGEIFDVLLTSVPPEILPSYQVILLAGDIEFDQSFLGELEKSLRRGSRVLMSAKHRKALGSDFERLARHGEVEVLEAWTNPVTSRTTAISNARLAQLARECLPLEISGDPIQYQIARTSRGWMVELINNSGVTKQKDQPAIVDAHAVARVTLKTSFPWKTAAELRSDRSHVNSGALKLEIGPGSVEYVEFQSQ